ncbi:DUF5693 family protein [Thalassobacillus pellis]|uniref:DUF5693 family protein n=1 Tax=Thalassobacillus pellis TaxID=748008 RepID=UPI001960887F|nr:DUF5693 family protein [Thalassobacillus pellis]MBM7551692.1 putative membrane protein [Thalassobacillus pellis]
MKKQLWLWSLIILLLLVSLPGLYERWNSETENDTFEFIVPYQDIHDLTVDNNMSLDHALSTLEESGLTTVSLAPSTLSSWARQDILTMYGQKELEEKLELLGVKGDYKQKEQGFYITVPEKEYYVDKINETFNPKEVTINGQELYFISDKKGELPQYPLGYNQKAIDKIKENGLNYILRLENHEDPALNAQAVEETVELKNAAFSRVLFSGVEVVGYPDVSKIKKWGEQLNKAGIGYYMIEMANQHGLQTVVRQSDYDVIRLHSLSLGTRTMEDSVDTTVRAVKERNIRAIFFHLKNDEPSETLKNASQYMETAINKMPDYFETGAPESYNKINTPWWMTVSLLIAGTLLSFLAASDILHNKLGVAALIFMGLLSIAYLLLGSIMLIKGFALIVAVITPIYAVAATAEGSTKTGRITVQYSKAIGISFAGIVIVTGLLNGVPYVTGFELFRGVKLVYIVPILFFVIYAVWDKILSLYKEKTFMNIWNRQITYGHLFIIGLIAFVCYYYISRTGNAGSVLAFELWVRQKLEELLFVRPRTKEFLIGFPFYLLALYVMGINKKWGVFLLVPGVIGFLSMMNTFTHFHIPLYISLLRTAYSLAFGYVIGIIAIYCFRFIFRYLSKVLRTRWS